MKNKNVMLICCVLGGWFGLHCFLENKIGKGILYLCTGGLFCIGWIVDIIKIATSPNLDNKKTSSFNYDYTTQNNDKKICWNCGTYADKNSSFCPNCGKDLYNRDYSLDYYDRYYLDHKDDDEQDLYMQNRTINFCDDYVVFDFETTGLSAKRNKIIEIGALKYKNNQLVDEFNVLVNPRTHIPDEVTDINGITDKMVADCDPITKVLPKFIEFIEDYTLIAYNASFDASFLESNIDKLDLEMIENKIFDALPAAQKYIESKNYKLATLKRLFNLDFGSHRSLEDCKTTNYIYQYCKSKAEK